MFSTKIRELAPWFHNIHLPDGTQTVPDHSLGDFPRNKWNQIKSFIPQDLTGKKILDVGCNAGYYSIELAKRGAEVTAIDLDVHYLKQAEWVAEQWELQSKIVIKQLQIYDLVQSRKVYDYVWFMGVFYHLRYPLFALDILSEKTKELMIFQSLTIPGEHIIDIKKNYNLDEREIMLDPGWPKMAFIEQEVNNDPTNWWVPNKAAIHAMFRSAGFKITATPGHEIYICRPDPELPGINKSWNQSEYLSATGKDWRFSVQKKVEGKNKEL